MLYKLLSAIGISAGQTNGIEDEFASRREAPRRHNDKCMGVIDGKAMPVVDWSMGGVRVFGDTRTMAVGQEVDVTLKFQVQNSLVNIQHRGEIVRKGRDTFALKFKPLTHDVRQNFSQIIDNFNAMEFATSQA